MMMPVIMLPRLFSDNSSFMYLSGCAALFGFFYQPLFALGYTMSVDILRKLDGHALKFATERLWGCVGYAALTAILGLILDFTPLDTYAFFLSFVVCAALFSAPVEFFEK